MNSVKIIVMGKTGVGKSTLVNATLKIDNAQNGVGQAVTKANTMYSNIIEYPYLKTDDNKYEYRQQEVMVYDTVGLELDESVNDVTLQTIRNEIKKETDNNDVKIVWFCIEETKKRFEDYEINLIQKLSVEYEIPFLIVLTKCTSKKEGILEKKLNDIAPSIMVQRVLAEKYEVEDDLYVESFGVDELLYKTYSEYKNCKVKLLQEKINALDEARVLRVSQIEQKGNERIEAVAKKGGKFALIPGICIPKIHAMCIRLIGELNDIAGLKTEKDFSTDLFSDVILGLIMTPLMIVPGLSSPIAEGYIEAVGKGYLKVLLSVISRSSDQELKNCKLVQDMLITELKKI